MKDLSALKFVSVLKAVVMAFTLITVYAMCNSEAVANYQRCKTWDKSNFEMWLRTADETTGGTERNEDWKNVLTETAPYWLPGNQDSHWSPNGVQGITNSIKKHMCSPDNNKACDSFDELLKQRGEQTAPEPNVAEKLGNMDYVASWRFYSKIGFLVF